MQRSDVDALLDDVLAGRHDGDFRWWLLRPHIRVDMIPKLCRIALGDETKPAEGAVRLLRDVMICTDTYREDIARVITLRAAPWPTPNSEGFPPALVAVWRKISTLERLREKDSAELLWAARYLHDVSTSTSPSKSDAALLL